MYILQSDFVLGISVTLTDGESGFMLVILTDDESGFMLVILTDGESGFMLVILTDGESGFMLVILTDGESGFMLVVLTDGESGSMLVGTGFLHLGNMTCFGYFVNSLYENTRIYLQKWWRASVNIHYQYSCYKCFKLYTYIKTALCSGSSGAFQGIFTMGESIRSLNKVEK